jgi:hypothetical protein
MLDFEPFPKIARLKRNCVITEKIDGTNAQVIVTEDGQIGAASRSRLITPQDDNYGFALWVEQNRDELLKLGPGRHLGEWWGVGIQRKYGLHERRFSLFNVSRWSAADARPACCHVVPIIYNGPFTTNAVDDALALLQANGSFAAPGFPKPEGIITWLPAAQTLFKTTIDKDDEPKSVAA